MVAEERPDRRLVESFETYRKMIHIPGPFRRTVLRVDQVDHAGPCAQLDESDTVHSPFLGTSEHFAIEGKRTVEV